METDHAVCVCVCVCVRPSPLSQIEPFINHRHLDRGLVSRISKQVYEYIVIMQSVLKGYSYEMNKIFISKSKKLISIFCACADAFQIYLSCTISGSFFESIYYFRKFLVNILSVFLGHWLISPVCPLSLVVQGKGKTLSKFTCQKLLSLLRGILLAVQKVIRAQNHMLRASKEGFYKESKIQSQFLFFYFQTARLHLLQTVLIYM